jgi:biopolymer transport protein ExbD
MTAATARTRVQLEPAADPNVIPFIDVLLVLLIIFMVTAPKPTTDMRVDLPRSTVGPASPIEPTIVHIRSGAAGARYFVDAEEASLGALGEFALAHMLASDSATTPELALSEGRIFVRADLDVAYADVVSAVETLQHASFRQVSIVAQNADEPA